MMKAAMARDSVDEQLISSRDDLVAWFEAGCKPQGPFRVGTEHEKIGFFRKDLSPLPYDDSSRGGVRALLESLRDACGWAPIEDSGALIGLYDEVGGGAISLEPGGQFELSGAPFETIHQTRIELDAHFAKLAPVCDRLGISFLDLGMSPLWTRDKTPVMPKQRYRIMASYMPRVGKLGLDMMFRTATVQTNLDFASEADMVEKLRLSLSLQPLFTAIFANSPFTDGKPNGFLSMRSQIWTDTDPDRTGMMAFAFEDGMGFERYVDYALDVPMYFVKRGDVYHDVAGASFRDLLAGKLPQLPGEVATISDWANHLSTIFPEVRLKRYLEMRGADVGPREHILGFSALCAGLFYDDEARRAVGELVAGWSAVERENLRRAVPREGFAAKISGRSLGELARDILPLARAGLARRAKLDDQGRDETIFLSALEEMCERGENLAQVRLALYHGAWGESVLPAFEACKI